MADQGLRHDRIAIGASAGGVEALIKLVSSLPKNLPAAILLAMHMAAAAHSRRVRQRTIWLFKTETSTSPRRGCI